MSTSTVVDRIHRHDRQRLAIRPHRLTELYRPTNHITGHTAGRLTSTPARADETRIRTMNAMVDAPIAAKRKRERKR